SIPAASTNQTTPNDPERPATAGFLAVLSRFLQKSKSVVLGQKTPTKRHESVTRLEAGSPAVASDLAQHDTETQSFLLLETFSSFERNHPA
ncbi:hypothetical protein, partial [Thiolapillus sp.]|uniref:hypothetical protein n=1 Tax=Thiolapillus sp. TaxID=2017437 RepID=UPI003AF938E9